MNVQEVHRGIVIRWFYTFVENFIVDSFDIFQLKKTLNNAVSEILSGKTFLGLCKRGWEKLA